MMERLMRKMKCSRLWLHWMNRKQDMIFRLGQRRKPMKVRVEAYPGIKGGVAACPRCGDFLYTKTCCITCGQKIIWDGR